MATENYRVAASSASRLTGPKGATWDPDDLAASTSFVVDAFRNPAKWCPSSLAPLVFIALNDFMIL